MILTYLTIYIFQFIIAILSCIVLDILFRNYFISSVHYSLYFVLLIISLFKVVTQKNSVCHYNLEPQVPVARYHHELV